MKHTWSWLLVLGVAGSCAGAKARREPPPVREDARVQFVQVVPLEHVSAGELASTLNGLLEASRRAIRFRGCALPQRGREVEMYRDDLQGREPRVEADPRTNSLLVTASGRNDLAHLLELIGRLDREEPPQH